MSANNEQVLEQLWVREAHDRLNAYDRGELEEVSAEEVFEELDKRTPDNESPHRSSDVNSRS